MALSAKVEIQLKRQWVEWFLQRARRFTPRVNDIKVSPTPMGWLFLTTILLQYLAATNYANNIIYAYAFLHFSVFVYIPYLSYKLCISVASRASAPVLVEEKQPFFCQVVVSQPRNERSFVSVSCDGAAVESRCDQR